MTVNTRLGSLVHSWAWSSCPSPCISWLLHKGGFPHLPPVLPLSTTALPRWQHVQSEQASREPGSALHTLHPPGQALLRHSSTQPKHLAYLISRLWALNTVSLLFCSWLSNIRQMPEVTRHRRARRVNPAFPKMLMKCSGRLCNKLNRQASLSTWVFSVVTFYHLVIWSCETGNTAVAQDREGRSGGVTSPKL